MFVTSGFVTSCKQMTSISLVWRKSSSILVRLALQIPLIFSVPIVNVWWCMVGGWYIPTVLKTSIYEHCAIFVRVARPFASVIFLSSWGLVWCLSVVSPFLRQCVPRSRDSFPGRKVSRTWSWPNRPEAKEFVELYLHSSSAVTTCVSI
jgi:hypothetical protein